MNNNPPQKMDRKQIAVGALVFMFPFLSLITTFGVSLISFCFLIAALFFAPRAGALLRRHWLDVRLVLLAFALNFLFALLLLLIHDGAHLGSLEKPVRMLAAVSVLVLVLAVRPSRKFLWWGVAFGALAGALFVGYQRMAFDLDRPGGLINAITFGDLSLCLGLIALVSAIDLRGTSLRWLPALGALSGLVGMILTGSRGGWVAFAFSALVFVRYSSVIMRGRLVGFLVGLTCLLAVGAYLLPQSAVRERAREGVANVKTYFSGGSAYSNIGLRLELWKGALIMIEENPLLGLSTNAYQERMAEMAEKGEINHGVMPVQHVHNDALHAMVTGGLAGLVIWAFTLVAPFIFFARTLSNSHSITSEQVALSLAGLLVVVCYFSFGLTEVIFWSVIGSMFYAMMIFLLMALSLNAKGDDAK